MHFKINSLEAVKELASKDEYAYLFENLEKKQDQAPDDLIEKIAIIFANEFNISFTEIEKVKFFVKLGYFGNK